MTRFRKPSGSAGRIVFVGAGPGDPGMLTARASAALEAGCSAPVAAYAEIAEGDTGPELFLRASVTAIDGSDSVRGSTSGPLADAAALGRALATELLDRGAAELMAVTTT